MQVRVIELAPGHLVYRQEAGYADDLAPELRAALLKVTDRRWIVEPGEGEGRPTLAAQAQAARDAEQAEIRGHDLVQAALARFPDAEFVEDEAAHGHSSHPQRQR
jgi:DNA polymerase-3 subunit gamma/tau